MAILETIKGNIELAGQKTADFAKRAAETIRLRDQIRRDNKEIRKLTYEIGQTYLRLHADDYDEVYKEFIEGIAAAKADIEDKMNQLAALQEKGEPLAEEADLAEENAEEDWDDFFEDIEEASEKTTEEAADETTAQEAAADSEEAATEAEATTTETETSTTETEATTEA